MLLKLKTSNVEKFTGETLDYLESRETLWNSQADTTASKNHIVDFSPENLAKFYENKDKISEILK